MTDKILTYAKRPSIYEESSGPFWDDEHISKGMLDAHLNETLDAATRPIEVVQKTVGWISSIVPVSLNKALCDLGCGPGIYTSLFDQLGYQCTGIDFSNRSIEYAKNQAMKNQQTITYHYQNYLTISYQEKFDVMMLIYCDYGVLSHQNRLTLLQKIFQVLKPGGKFIFDVFTPNQYVEKKESSSWYASHGSDFWSMYPHICLENHFIYPNEIRCDQYIVMDTVNNIKVYRVWDQAFTAKTIKEELETIGFSNIELYSDLQGTPYHNASKTIGVVATK